MNRILVTGATGLFGGEISRQLLAKGVPIRILVRDPSKAPALNGTVEVALGDFSDPESLGDALTGIDRMFLASYDQPEIIEHQANVLEVAKHCGVQHVVRLSSDGTEENRQLPIFRWHGECEKQLESSGLDFTHIKPMWIMQNFEYFVVNDKLRLPSADGRIGLVDHRDVAAVAVLALTVSGHEGKAHIIGTESLSHAEIAQELSEATGRTISYEDISPIEYQRELESFEWDAASIESMLGLFADVRAGINSDSNISDMLEPLLRRPGIKFRQFAIDYASKIGVDS